MLSIVVAMVVIVVLAALVLYYVAVPHRGDQAGSGGWLEQTMRRARGSVRTLGQDDDEHDHGHDHGDDQQRP
ncbi:hypothetical protein ABKW28_05810 [Nocardioides sp. 31GB23]|uniref:Secreted protein n=1 Tax=Nocardioides salarius TaxID=374513 RepID=A0ABS2M6U4_9ACTN|nr:hypothetical protein [Nocardioides salarius]MBM7506909.1 hypothetical protein [Nocardioides salarius]